MSPTTERTSLWWPLAIAMAALFLSGCFSSDSDKRGDANSPKGEAFHGADWASIKNLDPRGEQCIECHGNNADMSPFGDIAHNIGLKNNDTAATLGVEGLKITRVDIDEDTGVVTVTTNQPVPSEANLSMTFAKLAPRVIHNRGHDWQNYFSTNALAFTENRLGADKMMLTNGGVQPQTVPSPQVSGNTIIFSLGDGQDRSWGEHDFSVRSAYEADTDVWSFAGVRGTKVQMTDVADHMYCNEAHGDSNQWVDDNGQKPVCWWPDGTHLISGVFATENNEFVVAYEPDYTHRVTLIVGGSPGYNTWFDFVPSVANGDKAPADFADASTSLTGDSYIDPITGEIIADGYVVSEGNRAPGGSANNATHGHQGLPAAREVVDVQSCNSCHDSLSMHGGSRATTQTCVTCHNPGNLQASSGRSVDFKQLVHRIHRGANLPSELADISELMNGSSLVAEHATDFTKVRFPQGPTPGQAAGITNCVKCHMGAETKDMVQGLAENLGPGDGYDVQKELKLALETPQGDNWLTVRSINACQACHDSNVWLSGGGSINGVNIHRDESGNRDAADSSYLLDKYMAFYSDKYSGIGFEWLGKKESRTNPAGWVHNTGTADAPNRFTCGSSGGCHGNNAVDGLSTINIGNRATNAIQQVHLELTRNYIISDRFEINVVDVSVDETGFSVKAEVLDKKNGSVVIDPATHDADLGVLELAANGMFGWMANGSPDYNHSAGGGFGANYTADTDNSGGQPGSPAGLRGLVFDGSGLGSMSITWEEIEAVSGIKYDFATDFDKDTSFGTVAINANLSVDGTNHRLRSANQDFSFATGMLAEGDLARRQVVDFLAGNGVVNANSVDGWDKHDGANTQSCSSCHLKLDMHGATASNNTQMCVVCHNPNVTDIRARTKENGMVMLGEDGQYEESEDFKRLIHGVHAAADFRIDPLQTRLGQRPNPDGAGGHSFPGVLSNCQSCHIEDESSGQWTFELDQLPEGMIGSSIITADWATAAFSGKGSQHNLDNHMKMSPIASVCSSCHDAGYKTSDGRMNENIIDGGPYVGSHWWVMGGIAPGVVPEGELPQNTKHQSGK